MRKTPRVTPGVFPPTDWMALGGARQADPTSQREAATYFAERYWKPVYCYLRGFGHDRMRAEDLTQEFFARFLARGALGKADPARGRFRSFLLGSLTNFLRNEHRNGRAAKKIPAELTVSLHAVIDSAAATIVPRESETPEAAFHRAWTAELVLRVLATLEQEFCAGGKGAHYEMFRRFIVEPGLRGAEPPLYSALAAEIGVTETQVGFRLTTARRAYRRLLRDEIRTFARSEDEVDAEVDALFAFLARA